MSLTVSAVGNIVDGSSGTKNIDNNSSISTMFEHSNTEFTQNFILFCFITCGLLLGILWITIFHVVPLFNGNNKNHGNRERRQQSRTTVHKDNTVNGNGINKPRESGLSARQLQRLFDADYNVDSVNHRNELNGSGAIVLNDSRDDSSLNGPLIPLDCRTIPRPCLVDHDCTLLCRDSATLAYQCDETSSICVERPVSLRHDDHGKTTGGSPNDDGGGNDDENNSSTAISSTEQQQQQATDNDRGIRCQTDKGEYALLQGYNELGIAQWNCIQLFPGWHNPGERYCENGQMNMDTRVRVPSYADCICPPGTTRVVYARSQLGQQVYGLPHCVKQPHLYNLGTDYLAL